MFLDATRPQHGRHALRVTVPTAAPLTTMWAQACVDSYYPKEHPVPECNADSDGTMLPKNTRYTIELWARSDKPGMTIAILTGAWRLNATEAAAFHTVGTYVANETVASARLNGTWQRIGGKLAASADRYLQLQFSGGPGMVFIDNTFIGANMTAAVEESARLSRA